MILIKIICSIFNHRFLLNTEKTERTCKRCGYTEMRCKKCRGKRKIYEYQKGSPCKKCNGSGSEWVCDNCAGQGTICTSCGTENEELPCRYCKGSGYTDWRKCELCKGKGWNQKRPRHICEEPPFIDNPQEEKKTFCPRCESQGVFSRRVYRFCDMLEIENILYKCNCCDDEWIQKKTTSPATYPAPHPPPY